MPLPVQQLCKFSCKMKIAFHTCYAHSLPAGHRFPMEKYELIPQQLLHEGIVTNENFFVPKPVALADVLLVHTQEYVNKLLQLQLSPREQRVIGFPQSEALIQRELIITQGTIDCCEYAFTHGVSLNVAGGTHHAFSNRGEGFCLLNDIAVAAAVLIQKHPNWKILVVDLDVHQGNGTAEIFANSSQVFTFSMHGRHNYPFKKEQSFLDVPLEDGTTTETYLSLLAQTLPELIRKIQPNIIFYLSGVDILNTDKFGKLQVSLQGCFERDKLVFDLCKANQIPVVVSMGGGYSASVATIVNAHVNTFKAALNIAF